jgi:hypothetical protein
MKGKYSFLTFYIDACTKDVIEIIEKEREKFLDFSSPNDREETLCSPSPLKTNLHEFVYIKVRCQSQRTVEKYRLKKVRSFFLFTLQY